MNDNAKRTQAWLWLTVPIAVLTAIAAGSGLFIKGLYSASPTFVVAQTVGWDLVTLIIVLPALIISAIIAGRKSQRARLIWLGMLVYLVYLYIWVPFTVHFNSMFLIYMALLGCSSYALMGGLATSDLAGIKANFTEKTPVKVVSIVLGVMVVLGYIFWLTHIISAYIEGDIPQFAKWTETPTHAFYVLDMALIFPAMGLAAVWLWRKRDLGYTLAGVLLTTHLAAMLGVMSEMFSSVRYGHQTDIPPEFTIIVIIAAVTLGLLIWFLKELKQG